MLQVRLRLNPKTGKVPPSLIWAEAKGTEMYSENYVSEIILLIILLPFTDT